MGEKRERERRDESKKKSGGLAQLARALDLHSRGQGFDSLILHQKKRDGEKGGEEKERKREYNEQTL